ncbi:MAG TPA: phosphotransferase family protein [Mycobacteriales bacterium]|jgi:aminoglycoside phosphotransferase (APT) family kinase protein|nr:phosphotransferase family protein [Mycobacteriales bacterium]
MTDRLHADGCDDLSVGDLSTPSAGFSGQTMLFAASWRDAAGEQHSHDLVLRMQSSDHQVYLSADAVRQARTMQALARFAGVAVPHVRFVEPDSSALGAPFYVMDRVDGRVPVDVPSWHSRGWTVDLDRARRSELYDNGLSAMIALHRVDRREGLEFLAEPGEGTALARHVAMVRRWYDACEPGRRYGREVLATALEMVGDLMPADDAEVVIWGDARMGNIVFADDLSVAAMLDWEAATTGPPGLDLGWWLMFENLLCEARGGRRLEGIADRGGTIRRYSELGGGSIGDVDYYELLADVGIMLITSVIADNAVRSGTIPLAESSAYPNRIIAMMQTSINRLR